MAESQFLAHHRNLKVVPLALRRDVLTALKDGATLNQAADAAGYSPHELKTLLRWGDEGRTPWDSFKREVRRTKFEAQRPLTQRRLEIASAPEATLSETDSVLRVLQPEDYAPERQEGPGGGGITLNVHMQKAFEPYPSPGTLGPGDAEGEIVDGLLLNDDDDAG